MYTKYDFAFVLDKNDSISILCENRSGLRILPRENVYTPKCVSTGNTRKRLGKSTNFFYSCVIERDRQCREITRFYSPLLER